MNFYISIFFATEVTPRWRFRVRTIEKGLRLFLQEFIYWNCG